MERIPWRYIGEDIINKQEEYIENEQNLIPANDRIGKVLSVEISAIFHFKVIVLL